jgi:hypothetical protein
MAARHLQAHDNPAGAIVGASAGSPTASAGRPACEDR